MPQKELWLIRHAEGEHNVKGANYHYDPCLTKTGWAQTEHARRGIRGGSLDLLCVSPLRRTLQTAEGLFGEEMCDKLVIDDLREKAATGCNWRRARHEIRADFPEYDFSAVPPGLDPHINSMKEEEDAVYKRCLRFAQWLARQPERRVAIVTHYQTLKYGLLPIFVPDLSRSEKRFENCEIRRIIWQYELAR